MLHNYKIIVLVSFLTVGYFKTISLTTSIPLPISAGIEDTAAESNSESFNGRPKRQDFDTLLWSLLFGDDSSESEEDYLICRNCTIIVRQQESTQSSGQTPQIGQVSDATGQAVVAPDNKPIPTQTITSRTTPIPVITPPSDPTPAPAPAPTPAPAPAPAPALVTPLADAPGNVPGTATTDASGGGSAAATADAPGGPSIDASAVVPSDASTPGNP